MKIKILLISIFLCLSCYSEIKFLNKNLMSYEELDLKYFEINKSEGVSVFLDKDIKLNKTGSIYIYIEKNNSSANILSFYIPVEEKKKYFFSIFYKQKWESPGRDKYVGISSFSSIDWYDKNKKYISSSSISRFLYSECDWDLRDAILISPENSKFARIKVSISNNSEKQTGKFLPSKLWIDNLQFREYKTLEEEYSKDEISFFPAVDEGFRGKGSKWCKVIDDKDAIKKKAIYIPKVEENGIVFHSPYFPSLPEGLYRFEIRAKVNDIKENINLGFVDIQSEKSGTRLFIEFNSNSFVRKNQYISFKEDFIIREPGWWCIRVYTTGKNEWYIDNIRITPLFYFSENDIVEIYPGIEGFIDKNIYPRKEGKFKILVFKGLFYEDWLEDIFVEEDVEINNIYFEVEMNTPKFNRLPGDINEIFDNNIVILSNVNISALPLRQKNYIKEYVKRGGNLIIIPGHQSYRKEAWAKSILRDILPFEIDNIEFYKEGLSIEKFGKNVSVYYIQKIKMIDKNCKILIKADEYPFLIEKDYFKGKIFFFLGLNTGEKVKDEIPFWEWNKWKDFIRNLFLSLKQEGR